MTRPDCTCDFDRPDPTTPTYHRIPDGCAEHEEDA